MKNITLYKDIKLMIIFIGDDYKYNLETLQREIKKYSDLGFEISIHSSYNTYESLLKLTDLCKDSANNVSNLSLIQNRHDLIKNGELKIDNTFKLLMVNDLFSNNDNFKRKFDCEISGLRGMDDELISEEMLPNKEVFKNVKYHFTVQIDENKKIEMNVENNDITINFFPEIATTNDLPDNIKVFIDSYLKLHQGEKMNFFVPKDLCKTFEQLFPDNVVNESLQSIIANVANVCKNGGKTKLEQVSNAYYFIQHVGRYNNHASRKIDRYLKLEKIRNKFLIKKTFFGISNNFSKLINNQRILNKIPTNVKKILRILSFYQYRNRNEEMYKKAKKIYERSRSKLDKNSSSEKGIYDRKFLCSGYSKFLCAVLKNMRNRMSRGF